MVERYNYLIKTRFGDKYHCQINIKSEKDNFFLPPMAIQMLLENIIKHNKIDQHNPIDCTIQIKNEYLSVTNTKNLKDQIQGSSGIGLSNLKARYKFFTDKEVKVYTSDQEFVVEIPLLQIEHADETPI